MTRTILVGLLTVVFAQAEDAKLSLRTLALDDVEVPEWQVATGDEAYSKLAWPNQQPSPALMIQAGKELQLLTKVAGEDGEAKYQVAKKVMLPESASEILLLAAPGEKEGDIQLIPIADQFKQATFNDWLVINLSERKTNLRFGKDQGAIELESGKSGIYKAGGEPSKGAEVIAEAEVKEKMRKIYSTFWPAEQGQRPLVLFTEKNGRVKVRRIIDFLPAK